MTEPNAQITDTEPLDAASAAQEATVANGSLPQDRPSQQLVDAAGAAAAAPASTAAPEVATNPYGEQPDAAAATAPTAAPAAEPASESIPTTNPYVEQPVPDGYLDDAIPMDAEYEFVEPAPDANPYVEDPSLPSPVPETADDPGSTGPLPQNLATEAFDPHPLAVDLEAREDSEIEMGSNTRLSWAARTDVGLVRGHNEDSYLARSPLFGVCDGMGGHAAGEVASAIAVRAIAEHAPEHADDALLGAAVEAANEAVIDGAATGIGKPGMGCTASCCVIEDTHMAIAHAGDSRIYLLRAGTLVRVTHDHSFVEELVDAGEITADEARVHPSRSIITRALGSDPDMYADHFLLDVERGDRVIVCSDGLSSMVPDEAIEALAVSSATPHACVDNLVSAALAEGGHDNVTVIVVDVVSDGREEARRKALGRAIVGWTAALVALVAVALIVFAAIVNNSWYVGAYAGNVGIYHGIRAQVFGRQLSTLEQASDVSLQNLPEATQHQLAAGITVSSIEEAEKTVEAYREQIEQDRSKAEAQAADAQSESNDGQVGDASGAAGPAAAGTTTAATDDASTEASGDTPAEAETEGSASSEGGE